MNIKKTAKIYTAVLTVVMAVTVYMYFLVSDIKSELMQNMDSLYIHTLNDFIVNIDDNMKKHIPNKPFVKTLHKDEKLRKHLEHTLGILDTKAFKYVYILYKDKQGTYRYIVDGSKEDKGELDQPLDVNKKEWNKVYTTKKPNIIRQYKIDTLWTTYLYPIVRDKKVEAVIAVDFSFQLPNKIKAIVKPLDNSFIFIFISIFVLIILVILEFYYNYKIKQQSYTDALTQIYNRHYLREFLKNIHSEEYQILMFDIDFFKKVNDMYGHKAGDIILQSVVESAKKSIRDDDVFFRYGGEEFLIFIKLEDDQDIAFKVAQRLKDKIESMDFLYEENHINVTISIGINRHPDRFKTIDQAIKYTDEMLYMAKKDGRNCIRLEEIKQHSSAVQKMSIDAIKEAFEQKRVICYYQPIYNAKDLSIDKYEALVRIVTNEGKIIGPYFFLEEIFSTTLYTELTATVIDIVFKQIRAKEKNISLNLNFSDIIDTKTYSTVVNSIKMHRDLAKFLTIELLEYEKLEEFEILKERIVEIKSYGCKIAVDDFGNGYANYEIFKRLPIDVIKIDGSLIKDITESELSFKIVKSIIFFAKELNIPVIAEFVHSKEVMQSVQDLGAEYLQGFYLCEPKADIN